MEFNIELDKLINLFRTSKTEEFKIQYKLIADNYPTEEASNIMEKAIKEETAKTIQKIDEFILATNLKMQLQEVSKIVSLSYIARTYFNKSKSWLYQRINNNTVQGKAAKFTDEEIKKLQYAINDIGKKLSTFQLE